MQRDTLRIHFLEGLLLSLNIILLALPLAPHTRRMVKVYRFTWSGTQKVSH